MIIEMSPGDWVNSIGLMLDIAGAVLLLKFGLPPRIDPEGHIYIITQQTNEKEKALAKKYKAWSSFGVILIILGFAFQLLSNLF